MSPLVRRNPEDEEKEQEQKREKLMRIIRIRIISIIRSIVLTRAAEVMVSTNLR